MTRYITDGEMDWFLCDKSDCELKVVAKGIAACNRCDNWRKKEPSTIIDFYQPQVYEEETNDLIERYRRNGGF